MLLFSRVAWAALAVVLLPQLAFSGPIQWSYSTEVTYDQDYGSKFAVTLAPGGTAETVPGERSYVWLFNSTGNPRPVPGEYEARYAFTIAVTVTDLASQEAATVNFQGAYSSMWFYPPEEANNPNAWRWEYEASSFGDFWNGQEVTLGGNRYTLRGQGGGNGLFPFGELAVEIAPAVGTPEPGTFALAGLGLTAIGVTRVRRRVKPPTYEPRHSVG